MWVKQWWSTHDWEWFIPPIQMVMTGGPGDGLFLFHPHHWKWPAYLRESKHYKTLKAWCAVYFATGTAWKCNKSRTSVMPHTSSAGPWASLGSTSSSGPASSASSFSASLGEKKTQWILIESPQKEAPVSAYVASLQHWSAVTGRTSLHPINFSRITSTGAGSGASTVSTSDSPGDFRAPKAPEISTWRQELQFYIFYLQNCNMLKLSKPSSFHFVNSGTPPGSTLSSGLASATSSSSVSASWFPWQF